MTKTSTFERLCRRLERTGRARERGGLWVGERLRRSLCGLDPSRFETGVLLLIQSLLLIDHRCAHVDQPVDTTGEIVTEDRKSTRLNSSHSGESRMPSSA